MGMQESQDHRRKSYTVRRGRLSGRWRPGDGELSRQMGEESVGDAQIAFRVLEIDWVHFVGHRGRPHLSRDHALLKVAFRDIPGGGEAYVGK
jgi:hypothetical protein